MDKTVARILKEHDDLGYDTVRQAMAAIVEAADWVWRYDMHGVPCEDLATIHAWREAVLTERRIRNDR